MGHTIVNLINPYIATILSFKIPEANLMAHVIKEHIYMRC